MAANPLSDGLFTLGEKTRPESNGDDKRMGSSSGRRQEWTLSKKAVIAIVDDDQSVREALTGLIRSLGHNAVAFERAEDLLKSKRRRSMSCVIADVQMPGMSGPELYDGLVASGKPIPTILITAYPDARVRERALQAGVVGYLIKPFSEDDLLGCIQSILERRKEADNAE
jgi:FixJ family two-component response regulator